MIHRLSRLARRAIQHGLPARTLLFGPLSLGDDLLCTTVLREARRRGTPFAMMTNRPELFTHNDDPAGLIPVDDDYARALRRLGRRVIQPYYAQSDPAQPDRDLLPSGHILAQMCRLAGLEGAVALRPYLHLAPAERAAGRRLPARQIVFQSTGAGAAIPYADKEWRPGRFAEVVCALPRSCGAVQLGLPSDPLLPGALDLRGRTSLREAAAVLAASAAFVGLEGFLAHLARAVECPSVIVLGGRARPATYGYLGSEYLAAPTPCAPCGLRNTCSYGRACLEGVEAEAVSAALARILDRTAGPLPVATEAL